MKTFFILLISTTSLWSPLTFASVELFCTNSEGESRIITISDDDYEFLISRRGMLKKTNITIMASRSRITLTDNNDTNLRTSVYNCSASYN